MIRTAIALACLLAASCSRPPDPFPERPAQGWARSGKSRVFTADNLWQYIDGDVERYLQAGVQRALTCRYRYRETAEAVVDIYEMSAPAGARRILEAEPAAGSLPVTIGDTARNYGQSLTFSKGARFVRLTLYQDRPEAVAALPALAVSIEAAIGSR